MNAFDESVCTCMYMCAHACICMHIICMCMFACRCIYMCASACVSVHMPICMCMFSNSVSTISQPSTGSPCHPMTALSQHWHVHPHFFFTDLRVKNHFIFFAVVSGSRMHCVALSSVCT